MVGNVGQSTRSSFIETSVLIREVERTDRRVINRRADVDNVRHHVVAGKAGLHIRKDGLVPGGVGGVLLWIGRGQIARGGVAFQRLPSNHGF